MIVFPSPPAADPLHIFSPDSPITPAFMRNLLDTTIDTQPIPADSTPDQRADHRLATMHAIAAFRPFDALEAMLAGQMVAANARIMRCFALATEADADKAEARRDGAQATALIRSTQAMLRDFQRQQEARRKNEEQPSERAGYWFRDVSVPAPDSDPSSGGDTQPGGCNRFDPMQSGDAAPAATTHTSTSAPPHPTSAAPGLRENPVQRESARAAAPSRSPSTATGRHDPMPSEEHDLPDRMVTGDAMMRFASRRLDPNQSVEAAWVQAAAKAEAEEAENPMRCLPPGSGPAGEAGRGRIG